MKLLLLISLLHNSGEVRDQMLASNRRDTVCISYLTVREFKTKLAELETGGLKNPYGAVNQYGYMGKYQFSKKYVEKFGRVNRGTFLGSPHTQEIAMNRAITHYLNFIHQKGWDSYIGMVIGGILVTREGLLSGYHQHPVALKKWLESGGSVDLTDGNGTPVSVYVKKFDYRL